MQHGNMMQHGQWGENQMHHGQHGENQMQHGQWGGGQVQPVVCPTQYRHHDQFIPREVPFIHPIVNVNRQHIVEVPRHFWTETTENVMGQTLPANPGMGPQHGGGCNRGFGGRGRGRCRGRGRSRWM